MALIKGTIPVVDEYLIKAVKYALDQLGIHPDTLPQKKRRTSLDGIGYGGAGEYNGYFTIKLRTFTEGEGEAAKQLQKIVVCDGKTYDSEKGTSENSFALFAGIRYPVAYWEQDLDVGEWFIIVAITGLFKVEIKVVNREYVERMTTPYYIIGEYTYSTVEGVKITQRHGMFYPMYSEDSRVGIVATGEPIIPEKYYNDFTINAKLNDDGKVTHVVVCDGHSYDIEESTSEASIATVNGVHFYVDYWQREVENSAKLKWIVVEYVPVRYGDQNTIISTNKESICRVVAVDDPLKYENNEESREEGITERYIYIIGYYMLDAKGYLTINQRHQFGDVEIEYFAPCANNQDVQYWE